MRRKRLKIVVSNERAGPPEDGDREHGHWPDPDTTELSDEHLGHIWRLSGLGEFNRAQWERQHAYHAFKRDHWKAMQAASAAKTEAKAEEQDNG